MSERAREFVRGRGRYVDDLRFPEMLHLRIVRSVYARARVLRVRGAIDGQELKATLPASGEGAGTGPVGVGEPALAQGEVQYVGQAVGAVVAPTVERAEDLLASVEVDYEPLTPVPDLRAARNAPPIHASLASNVMAEYALGPPFEPPTAPLVLEEEFRIARVAANPLEPRGAVARFESGRLTVHASTQSVFSVRAGLATALGLAPENIRVMEADTGGAFGSKGSLYPEHVIAAYVAMKTGRPVKWVETRTEHLTSSRHGRGAEARMRLYAERDGTIRALEADVSVDGGAYFAGLNAFTPRFIGFQLTGPYAIERARVRAKAFYTNRVPLGPYRGAGRPEAAYFLERMLDRLADETGLDALEVRRRNATAGPFRSPLGLEVEATRPFLEEAAAALAYDGRSAPGVGFSWFVLVPAFGPGEGARLKVEAGRLHVWVGSHDHGQDHDGWLRGLLASELDVPEEAIVLERGDTDALERGVGTWGSRSAMVGAAAVLGAARKLRASIESEKGRYDARFLLEGHGDITVFEPQTGQSNALGANLVKAAATPFGTIEVREVRAYYDVGRALNRAAIDSQVVGGTLQAVGQTLGEEIDYDDAGQVRTMTLGDAGVASALPGVPTEVGIAEHPSRLPHGAKGVGEAPTVGVPPALVRAVETDTGRHWTELPLRAHDVYLRRSALP